MKKEKLIPGVSPNPKNKFIVFICSVLKMFGLSFEKKKDGVKPIVAKPIIALSNAENLRVDEDDVNLFYDTLDKKFSIRVIKQKSKDQCVFATSIPHKFKKVHASLMKNTILQLVEVEISQTHELLLTKSPAVKFSDIGEDILNFLFAHIRNLDHWMGEKIIFNIAEIIDELTFSSTLPTYEFKSITKRLSLIKGLSINNGGSVSGFDAGEENGLNYDFNLYKGAYFKWDELILEIEKVFQDYFKGGVEFRFKCYTLGGVKFKTRNYKVE